MRACLGILTLLISLALPALARAQVTLLNTLGTLPQFQTAGSLGIGSSLAVGYPFTVPAGSYRVDTIELAIGVSGSLSSATVEIYQDDGAGLPTGTPIITSSIPGPIFETPSLVTVNLPPSAVLAGGQTYHIAVSMTGTGVLIWATGFNGANSGSQRFGGVWSATGFLNRPAVRIIGASLTGCTPGNVVDTFIGGTGFNSFGGQAVSAGFLVAYPFTISTGTPVFVSSVTGAIGVASGSVDSVEVAIYPSVGGLPGPSPLIVQGITSPLFSTLAVVTTPISSPVGLSSGEYFVAYRVTGSGFLGWGTGTGSTAGALFTGGSWASTSFPAALAVRVSTVCTPPIGACCSGTQLAAGCLVLSPEDCATIGGIFAGVATCAAASCSINTVGACCSGATCSQQTKTDCLAGATNRFLGINVACNIPGQLINICCPADFNGNNTADVPDIFRFLEGWFAACP